MAAYGRFAGRDRGSRVPHRNRFIHVFLGGSALHVAKAQGTDDLDFSAVYAEPPGLVLGLESLPDGSMAGNDRRNGPADVAVTLYSLKKCTWLTCDANPTALPFLFAKGVLRNPIRSLVEQPKKLSFRDSARSTALDLPTVNSREYRDVRGAAKRVNVRSLRIGPVTP